MSTFPFKKAAFAVTAAGVLFVTGCSAPAASSPASTSAAASESPSAVASPAATNDSGMPASAMAAPGATMDPIPGGGSAASPAEDPWPLHVDATTVKAGNSIRVYGETLTPGSVVKIHGAQQMAMPSYDAATDTYTQVGEEVILTDIVSATVGPDGKYDTKLLIPAGTPPQLLNIVLIDANGGGNLVQTTVE